MCDRTFNIHLPQMPYYLSAIGRVYEKDDLVKVDIHSKIHVNKKIEIPNSWSLSFVKERHKEFMGDVIHFMVKRYGLKPAPFRFE